MKKVPPFVLLTAITLVAAFLLAVTNSVTEGPIATAAAAAADAARRAVLPAAESFSELPHAAPVDDLYVGLAGEAPVGHTATVTVTGFGGPIEIVVGIDQTGKLTGLNVGGSSFAETPGLGSKSKDPAFTSQFVGKTAPLTLNADIDAISGATITSRAVVNGVNAAAEAVAKAE